MISGRNISWLFYIRVHHSSATEMFRAIRSSLFSNANTNDGSSMPPATAATRPLPVRLAGGLSLFRSLGIVLALLQQRRQHIQYFLAGVTFKTHTFLFNIQSLPWNIQCFVLQLNELLQQRTETRSILFPWCSRSFFVRRCRCGCGSVACRRCSCIEILLLCKPCDIAAGGVCTSRGRTRLIRCRWWCDRRGHLHFGLYINQWSWRQCSNGCDGRTRRCCHLRFLQRVDQQYFHRATASRTASWLCAQKLLWVESKVGGCRLRGWYRTGWLHEYVGWYEWNFISGCCCWHGCGR